jgi:hypothetical protein
MSDRQRVRERLTELLAEDDRYRNQWIRYVKRSSGEISFDAVARVIANREGVEHPEWYRKYSRRVAGALKSAGSGPTWQTLRLIMDAFEMTEEHCRELKALMRSSSGPDGTGTTTTR